MRLTHLAVLLASFLSIGHAADEQKHRKPCTIKSPSSGLEFDLSGLAVAPKEDHKKKGEEPAQSWTAKGYDYGVNFTMNICAPVVEELDDVKGVNDRLVRNISAYYSHGGRTFSIGYIPSEAYTRSIYQDSCGLLNICFIGNSLPSSSSAVESSCSTIPTAHHAKILSTTAK